ncbi:hypothetical protein POM88_008613 [Heracleum sosnowskyi]|uniref:Uncharacterized protein n=1 Tax=Heracleum sosnowskyi TaxID=360622 RepID=A0AAD8J6H5_9APIA|nr:hypothetical protein POM88_008613 [Heracleum sosnowskyi]
MIGTVGPPLPSVDVCLESIPDMEYDALLTVSSLICCYFCCYSGQLGWSRVQQFSCYIDSIVKHRINWSAAWGYRKLIGIVDTGFVIQQRIDPSGTSTLYTAAIKSGWDEYGISYAHPSTNIIIPTIPVSMKSLCITSSCIRIQSVLK